MSLPSPRLPHRHPARWLWVLLLVWVMEGMTPTASGSPRPDGGQFDSKRGTTLKSGTGLTQASFTWQNNALGSVTGQDETWAAAGIGQPARTRSTVNTYDLAGRLDTETITEVVNVNARLPVATTYSYDSNGNRTSQGIQDAVGGVQMTSYAWDAQDRLKQVTMPDGVVHGYRYDHRTRRIGITKTGGGQAEQGTTVVFSGGLSLAEWEVASASLPTQIASPGVPTVEYSRGPDMGGGVGGLLYSRRGTTLKYNLSNGRGDIVAQTDGGGSLTWTASYEAYGKRTKESGTNDDKQRANSKDEDPTGLLNEGFRYRDLETGVWLSRDPAGFVDGPNLYAYVKQNPWTAFDPDGLWAEDLALGIPSLGVGVASLASNIKKGHVGAAIWDGVGIVADAAAVLLPGVPGGVGLGTKAARLAAAKNKVENAIDTAETVVDVGTATATGDPAAFVQIVADKALDKAMGSKKRSGGNPTSSARPPPNPNGSKGKEDHQRANDALVKDFNERYPASDGYEVRSNQSIKAETGLNRRPDAAAIIDGKVVEVGEVARTRADNTTLVSREQKKQVEYEQANIPSTVKKIPGK